MNVNRCELVHWKATSHSPLLAHAARMPMDRSLMLQSMDSLAGGIYPALPDRHAPIQVPTWLTLADMLCRKVKRCRIYTWIIPTQVSSFGSATRGKRRPQTGPNSSNIRSLWKPEALQMSAALPPAHSSRCQEEERCFPMEEPHEITLNHVE